MSDIDVLIERAPVAGRRVRLAGLAGHLETRRAAKYGIVGVTNVAIDFLIYALLVSLGLWYVAAKTLSLAVATLNGYTFNRRWTFRAGPYCHVTLAKYASLQGACLLVNILLLALLIEVLGRDEIVAQAMAIPPVALMSFLGNRLWTFGPRLRRVQG